MQKHTLNYDTLLRCLILLGFIVLLSWLTLTKQLILYTNPKLGGLVELAGYVLFLMFITQTLSIFKPATCPTEQPQKLQFSLWKYLPFLTVLTLAFTVPSNTLSASLINNKGLNSEFATASTTMKASPRPLAAELQQQQFIQITDNNFIAALREINRYSQDYVGKEVSLSGIIHKVNDSHEFSLVRYMIVCCASDAMPFGLSGKSDQLANFEEGSWVSMRGVIQKGSQETPVIKVLSLEQTAKPANPYVYWQH